VLGGAEGAVMPKGRALIFKAEESPESAAAKTVREYFSAAERFCAA